jgi:chromate transporter
LTSFGGPIAHLGYFRQEFVERRKWVSEQTFADLVALCNFLPGPTSSQVCYSIGMTRGGIPGAISAWSAFTIPSAIIMLLAAYGIHWLSGEQGASWLHGLKVVAVAVVAQAVWSMATKLCTDRTRISFAFGAAVIILLTNSSWVQVLTIALGALAGWKLIRAEAPPERSEMFTRLPSRNQSIRSMAVFAVCLLIVPLLAAGKRDGWLPLFDSFYRTGALVFGGGHVVLPLLQAEVVPKGWLDNNTFLAGYGIAQALPGPLFSFAAYLGAAKGGSPNGWQGYGVFSRFCCHRFYWSLACSRSGIDFGLPPRLSHCWLGPMRQSLEFYWQRFISLFGQVQSIPRRAWRSPSFCLLVCRSGR